MAAHSSPRLETPAPAGIYRAGYPFTAEELQVMTNEGVLRYMLADVYAEAGLKDTSACRALAAGALLNQTLRRRGVICGEAAAWVHLGHLKPPGRTAVIASGTYRKPTAATGRWQVHQVQLATSEIQQLGRIRVTTPDRTVVDLFTGVGLDGSPMARPLDTVLDRAQHPTPQLLDWPLAGGDYQQLKTRLALISRLLENWSQAHTVAELAERITQQLCRRGWDDRREICVRDILAQCVSRRLPTVR